MKPLRLHHVGIIMPTMEKAEAFLEQFGLEKDYMEYVDAYHAYCLFTKYTKEESPVELIIPTEGVLTKYRDGKGGLHHIAFEVEDVRKAREEYEAKGLQMLEETPVTGAGGIIVNFLRPRYGFGVLVEFVQRMK
ncbi:VOC family protein [Mediterraneibacter sp. NSJ-55]|uniref:VOC family protein n=1 Tax=Mediterraneibacter hominis TaxID=2763054 RepID=A0A923LJV2_9FIRM|nr:VOC family protein [Mediterraneibacter hominis]MBC5689289.1 VOC family protein [Mediterraneibacter hominis]